ncbi:MAG: Hpt domain-containing protein [Cardiobacteriaceae bacterium]|nr:Hpt domain-containing protein [Cardiobacteriaceae bacterium]
MAGELGNQLLARVQDEMVRNISTAKRQLIEWLERPESGGVGALRENLSEVSGGLSLLGRNEAVNLVETIAASVESLNHTVTQNGVTPSFVENGAEIASGLLVLSDYIERLDHITENQKKAVEQATEAVKSIATEGADKIPVSAQPFINRDTYLALSAKVNEIIETSRNQIEHHARNPSAPFNVESIIGHNKNLIHLFEVLNLQTPQLLLKQINQMLAEQLSDKQWIDVAEAMILVQETLRQLDKDKKVKQASNYQEALQLQSEHSRQLEIDKLIRDTGKLGKRFFESLRKEVLQTETIKLAQPWREAAIQLLHYSAITALVGFKDLAIQLQRVGLLFTEFTLQNDQDLNKAYVPVVDTLVAVEYLFNDLAEAGKISLQDIAFLSESAESLEKINPVSAKAKSLFAGFASMAPQETEDDLVDNGGDIQQFKDVLDSSLDVLADDFSSLENIEEKPEEEAELPSVLISGVHSASATQQSQSSTGIGKAQLEHHDDAPVVPMNQGGGENLASSDMSGGQSMSSVAPATATEHLPPVSPSHTVQATQSPEAIDDSHVSTSVVEQEDVTDTEHVEASSLTNAAESMADAADRQDVDGHERAESGYTETLPVDDSENALIDVAKETTAMASSRHDVASPAINISEYDEKLPVAGSAVPTIAYFAGKSLPDLQAMDVPVEKMSFVGSHADAVMDDEIREFFNEELGEIVISMNDVYPQWRNKPDDSALTTDIRRAFHTLKGSGRTVGYEALGEFAWQHEQLLNRVIEKDFNANSLVCDTVGDAVSLLNVLQTGSEFVEHKGALLQQALVAERVRLSLLENPESEQSALDSLSRKLRLSDGQQAQDIADNAVSPVTAGESDGLNDWAALSDIRLEEESTDKEVPAITLETDAVHKQEISTAPLSELEDTVDTTSHIGLAEDDLAAHDAFDDSHTAPVSESVHELTILPNELPAKTEDAVIAEHSPSPHEGKEALSANNFSEQPSYNKALHTLQRGLRMGEPDADMQAALAETIRRQWQENFADDPALRAAMAQSLIASFQNNETEQAQWVADILEQANNAGTSPVPVQPGLVPQMGLGVPRHEAPVGITQEAYDRMLTTLRRGLAAGTDEDMQTVLSDTISRQWLQQGISTEGETRDNIVQHLKAALASEGSVDESLLDNMLSNVPHRVPSILPEGVRQDSYGVMMETLRSGLNDASNTEIQEALATAIGNQWQNQNSLQDSAIRAAVAEQMAAVLGGNGHENAALVEAVLNRAAEKAKQPPAGINEGDYQEVLETLRTHLGEAQTSDAQETLAAQIGARWQQESLQDEATRDAIAQRIIAALGGKGEADTAAVEAILNRIAAQVPKQEAGTLPVGVRQDAYDTMLQTLQSGLEAAQGNAAAQEALAATIGAQWQEPHSLQDSETRAAVAQQIATALGGEADAATIGAVLERAAAQTIQLPTGVKQEAYGAMLQTLQSGLGAAQGNAAAQEALAATIGAQWQEPHSLQDSETRAVVAQQIAMALGEEADVAAIEAILERAAVKNVAISQLPEAFTPDIYNRLLSMLRRGLLDDDADTQFAMAATLQRQWQQQALPRDTAAIDQVKEHLNASLLAEGIDAGSQLAQIFADAELDVAKDSAANEVVIKAVLSHDETSVQDDSKTILATVSSADIQEDQEIDESLVNPSIESEHVETSEESTFVDMVSQSDEESKDVATVTLEPPVFVDATVEHDLHLEDAEVYPENIDSDVVLEELESDTQFIDTAVVPGDIAPDSMTDIAADNLDIVSHDTNIASPTTHGRVAVPLSSYHNAAPNAVRPTVNPAERLNQELASLAQHPGLDNALNQDRYGESGSATANRAGFLRAVDQFETLSQLADKNDAPEVVDDLLDSVYEIEDSIDSEVAPPWIWRLLDSIEQLLLTHKHEGTPLSLSCASVLRQSAGLIENFEEEANEDDAIEAINALMNARREMGGAQRSGDAAVMPYSGEPLGSELVADPNANTMLAETFIDEAMSLFAHSQEEAERWDENREQLSRLDAVRRDMHTLKGSARMAGYNAIGDLTHGVESLIDGIVSGQVEASSKATAILVGAMWQGMLMLDTVRDGYLPQTDPYILNNIHSYLNQPLPYPQVAEAAEAARQAQQQAAISDAQFREMPDSVADKAAELAVEEVPIVTDFDDNIDPVLVDIFTDEAQELLQTTSQLLEDDFSKKEVVEELQRTMHTLKGGARLVGFTAIGDTAHLMESVIDKIPDLVESKVRQAKTLLNFGLDAHYEMLDSVMRHEMPQPALEVNDSLKIFAESGQYRVPAQRAGSGQDDVAEPDTAPQQQEAAPEEMPAAPLPDVASESRGQESQASQAKENTSPATDKAEQQVVEQSQSAANAETAQHASTSAEATAPVSERGENTAAQTAQSAATTAADHKADITTTSVADTAASNEVASKPPVLDIEHAHESRDLNLPQEKAETPRKEDKAVKEKEPQETPTSSGDLPRYVRVDAQLLDDMIAMTGETAIMRSRMENVISEAEFNLNELTRVTIRIAEQMRRLDGETEAQMLYRREQQGEDDLHFDPLEMDRFSEIQQLSRQLSEAIDDLKNLQDTLSQDNTTLRNLSNQQGIIQRNIQDHLLTTQLMRFDVHEARLRRLVRQTAKSVGKEVNFLLEGGEVEVERRLLEDILPALEHMIRNSLAHGVEKPEVRRAAGKPEIGTIKVAVSVHAAELSVRVIDDGQGLNYDRIREKAAAKGMLDAERADDESYLSSLILRSGFSTAESLSQLAGRGVGMDVVNEMVKQRRGQISVYSIRDKGTEFTLNMPFSMSIAEVLLVEIAGQNFAAPMSSIAVIGQVERELLQRSYDGEVVYQHYNDQDYRQFILGAYFKPEQYVFSMEENSAPALFIDAGGEPVAFHVDRILNRLEIIVKNVNRQVLNIPGISGATILGDGRVVPVLELLDLSRRIADLKPIPDSEPLIEEISVPNVLVVDDSVTMRKVSTRLLERHHYNVATAKDGLDAIEVLANFNPDIILLDIEMPRMDGFEFAAYVRKNSAVPQVPIVMITSRTGDKHRERADAIGVQGYLGKPYSEDVLIQTLEFLLKKRGEIQ